MLTIYKSSAGAGKTFTLVGNYIDLLFFMHGKNRHRRILAVTFTKKATAEMKSRIVSELNKLARGEQSSHSESLKEKYDLSDSELKSKAGDILIDILQDYGFFAVSTIDSFFQQIIRSFAREMDLPGAYNLELDSKHILQMAVDDYFFNLPQDIQDSRLKVLMQIVEENIANGVQWNPKNTMLSLSNELFKEIYQTHQTALDEAFQDSDILTKYRDKLNSIIEDYYNSYHTLQIDHQHLLTGYNEKDFSNGERLFAPFHWTDEHIKAGKLSFTDLQKFANNEKNILKKNSPAVLESLVEPLRQEAVRLIDLLVGKGAEQYITAKVILQYLNYLKLFQDIRYYIDKANAELNRLPLSETNRLLGNVISGQGDSPFVYDKIGTRIAHYMIDEFQDTSSMQWKNFRPLVQESAASGGKNMLVGDVKQSIYRWRNSDSSLLQYEINRQFENIDEQLLDTNWRSDEVIIEQNNEIFLALARQMQIDYNNLTDTESSHITDIYATVAQHTHEKEKGYIRIEFTDHDLNITDSQRLITEKVVQIVSDVKSRQIPLGRIAVLIRKNSEATIVAQALMEAGIPVMSNEAMLIKSSPAVRLVTDILRLSLTPDDPIIKFRTAYEYSICLGNNADDSLLSALRADLTLPQLKSSDSLTEQVENIISTLRLSTNDCHKPYLQAFLDETLHYTQKYSADVFSFLQWWDIESEKAAIQMNNTTNAVQIISIHKSKGLEYDIVIIPFCNWSKSVSSHTNILWVTPEQSPFDMLPIVPVKFNKSLANSIFREDYLQELENLYIDNLNIAYVAFTRAKRELYVFAPKGFDDKKEDKNIGAMLHKVLCSQTTNDIYEQGVKVTGAGEEKPSDTEPITIENYDGKHANLQVKLPSRNYFMHSDDHSISSQVNIGTLMHDILCQVVQWGDEISVVQNMINSGRLTNDDLTIVNTELQRVKELTTSTDWFSERWQVINEHDIILPDGSVRRPDRLMLSGKQAIIADWKFGDRKLDEHAQQVSEYMQLLKDMGYDTEGWLCYVNRKEIIKVNRSI